MSSLPLWGYWPLAMLLGTWILILAVFVPRIWMAGSGRNHWLLASLSGLLFWLGFPDMPFAPLLFGAFVPLFLIENALGDGPKATRRLAFHAYHAFLLWNILSTFWVCNTALFAGIFANVVNAGLMTLAFLLYHIGRQWTGERFRWVLFTVWWMSFEYLHLQWAMTWPFLNLSNGWACWPQVIQWYSFTGGFGGTLWILVGNILVYQVIRSRTGSGSTVRRPAVRLVVWLVLPVIVSLCMWVSWEPEGEAVEVAVVQPNFEPHYEKFRIPPDDQYRRFRQLALSVLTPETRYLVFPETSFGNFDLNRLHDQPYLADLTRLLDSFPSCALIVGLDPYRFLSPGESSQARRPYVQGGRDTLWWEASNMAAQMASGTPDQFYTKGKLVPGAETFPFRRWLFFLEPLVDKLGGSLEGLPRSTSRGVFQFRDQGVGPVICYESVFGEYVTGYVTQGADVLAIITNDGWWDRTPGHRQHLLFGALRAIETRRDIMRSANTGISCLINQRGEITLAQPYGETRAFRGTVRLNRKVTTYVRWGDVLARIALFLLVSGLMYGLYRWIMRRITAS